MSVQALQEGCWVLLDELNLAPQSVLEVKVNLYLYPFVSSTLYEHYYILSTLIIAFLMPLLKVCVGDG